MENLNKLEMIQKILEIQSSDKSEIERIGVYLSAAEKEIIEWRFGLTGKKPDEFPSEYDMVHVWAVINGFSQAGAEGQSTHSENGVARTFNYSDMIQYIHRNVRPMVGVLSR